MKIDFSKGSVTLVIAPVDGRSGFDCLAKISQDYLHIDVNKGQDWVVFINRNRTMVKVIHSDAFGNLLLTRRLHQGKFQQLLHRAEGVATKPISPKELQRYLDGEQLVIKRTSLLKG